MESASQKSQYKLTSVGQAAVPGKKQMFRNAVSLLATAIAVCGPLPAQNAAAQTLSAELNQNYARRKDEITKAAAKMPERYYSFRPTPEIRTFAQQLDHIAEVQAATCGSVLGQKPAVDTTKTSKSEVIAALKQSFDICDQAYNSTTDANAGNMVGSVTRLSTLWFNASHDNEMYGTIAVYLRLKGIVPPSSEPAK
jgi:uncharacterized damage-inducible protein DinB